MYLKTVKTSDFTAEDFERCYSNLSPNEKQHILKKGNAELQKCTLAGLITVKKGLKEYYGIENLDILRSKNGKPYLKDNQVCFSISHTTDTVAVAFSEYVVGIDIEYVREVVLSVCRRFFTEKEELFAKQSDINFTKIWTLKEAAVKASGEGIKAIKKYSFDFCGEKITTNIPGAAVFQKVNDNLIISVIEIK